MYKSCSSDSVFFGRKEVVDDDIYDEEIRKNFSLFGEKITDQNLDEICRKLITKDKL